jgi:hypothetical protein
MEIRTDLRKVTSILKVLSYEHLYEYLSIDSYKKTYDRHYFSWTDAKSTSFCSHKAKWIKVMEDLCKHGVVIKSGETYTTTKKVSDEWISSCIENDSVKQLNMNAKTNHIYLMNLEAFRDIKSKTQFKNFIYISLIGLYQDHGSLTRSFISELTGCSKYQQLKIEEKNEDIIEVTPRYRPVDTHNIDWDVRKLKKGSNSPCFPAYVSESLDECFITTTKKSNCYVVQTGNSYKINHKQENLIKIKNIVKFKNKNRNKINKILDYFDFKEDEWMSEAILDVNSRASFNDVSLVLDLDKENRNEFQHYLTPNNMGRTGFRKFKRLFNDFQNMIVIDSKGNTNSMDSRLAPKLIKKYIQK